MKQAIFLKTLPGIIAFFTIPIFLIFFWIIPIEYRLWILWGYMLFILFFVIKEKWTLEEIWIHKDKLKISIISYVIFTAFIIWLIFIFAHFLNKGIQSDWYSDSHFFYIFTLSSFAQEFIFRGYLVQKLKMMWQKPIIVILLSAFLYAIVHIIYPDAIIMFALSLILGIWFSSLYYYFPNLIIISISHSIINFTAVLYCFVNIAKSCW